MPRLNYRTPRMCRDRQQAFVRIDGQRVQLGRWGTDQAREAYDRIIAEWLNAGRTLPTPVVQDEPLTLTEIAVAYISHVREKYVNRDTSQVEAAVRLARSLYGSDPAEAFGPKRLRVVRQRMVEDDRLARRTINERIGWIKAMFRWAASHELCSERIHRRLDTVPGLRRGEGGRETKRIKPVPRPHVRRVRPHLTRPVRGLIALQLLTGARAGELVNLRATDIDTGGKVWTLKLDDHKTAHHDKDRTIYFGPRSQRILRLFMRPGRPIDAPLFDPRESNAEAKRRHANGSRRPDQKPTPKQSERSIGDAYTVASYRRAIHRASRVAVVPQWSPHRLRHNAATSLRREFGIDVAAAILGHSSLAVTATYAELNDKKAREVIARVG